ncbi:unnamed protein product [Prorocentrum cordatum]|uniref:Peptidase M20 dimerisation domain-containing protein n=1 Tax=Prorocentrum cordatum TaxID=2364126 RepID=A0ABN9UD68_9DINO|nr:unnamed protein product [Polarella glacialis]
MLEKWCCDPFAAQVRDGYVLAAGSPDGDYAGRGGPCIYGRGIQDSRHEVRLRAVPRGYREAAAEARRRVAPAPHVPPDLRPRRGDRRQRRHGRLLGDSRVQGLAANLVAMALDEGLANPRNAYTVFYGERTPWWLIVRAQGPTGHGSRFIKNTAFEKMLGVLNKAQEFRREQEEMLGWDQMGCKHCQAKKLGDVTTLNVTMLKGGVTMDSGQTYSLNVIPTEMEAGFDVRLSPNLVTSSFKAKLDEWCNEEGLTWEFAQWTKPLHEHYLTPVERNVNPFWGIFEDAVGADGAKVEREIFPAGTDSRFLRAMGVKALGFSPMRSTPVLLHEHNEALSVDMFLEGIGVYCRVIEALLDTPRQEIEQEGGAGQPPAKRARPTS